MISANAKFQVTLSDAKSCHTPTTTKSDPKISDTPTTAKSSTRTRPRMMVEKNNNTEATVMQPNLKMVKKEKVCFI